MQLQLPVNEGPFAGSENFHSLLSRFLCLSWVRQSMITGWITWLHQSNCIGSTHIRKLKLQNFQTWKIHKLRQKSSEFKGKIMCLLTFSRRFRYIFRASIQRNKVWKSADTFLGQHYKVALLHSTSITKTYKNGSSFSQTERKCNEYNTRSGSSDGGRLNKRCEFSSLCRQLSADRNI